AGAVSGTDERVAANRVRRLAFDRSERPIAGGVLKYLRKESLSKPLPFFPSDLPGAQGACEQAQCNGAVPLAGRVHRLLPVADHARVKRPLLLVEQTEREDCSARAASATETLLPGIRTVA